MKDDGVSPLSTGLLLPDAVKRVCDEGMGLRWDHDTSCYEVVDGALFEKRFDELRRKRDRDDGSNGRPFSRMHKYYKLEAGERWAKTGARFSPKSPLLLRNLQAAHGPDRPANFDAYAPIFEESYNGGYAEYEDGNNLQSVPAQEVGLKRQRNNEGGYTDYIRSSDEFTVANSSASSVAPSQDGNQILDANNIKIRLRTRSHLPYVSDTMEVSLQKFLDAVDAGGQYLEALQQREAQQISAQQSPDYSTEASSPQSDAEMVPQEGFVTFQPPKIPNGMAPMEQRQPPQFGVPPAMNAMEDEAPPPSLQTREESRDLFGEMLQAQTNQETLGEMGAWGLWNEASKGDQAYFFRRKVGQEAFFNGAVIALRDGVLVPADDLKTPNDIFLVVSDNNAKWKGDPHPTKDQEHLGHWCAYLGQVPLQVAGPVKAGDYLGPVGDGSGLARVVRPGQAPVVGLALAAKTTEEVGTVKGMISIGLNALSMPAELPEEQHAEVMKRLEKVGERLSVLREEAREAKEKATRAVAVAEKAEGRVKAVEQQVSGIEAEVFQAKAQQARLNKQLDTLMEEPVLSRRQYLWSCFCGLFSITVTEQGSRRPAKSEPAKPQSLVQKVTKTCVEVMDDVVSDTIVNLAMTCVLLNGWNLLGLSDTFSGVVHECLEMVFHFCFLLYFLKPVGMVGRASYWGFKQVFLPPKEGQPKKTLSQAVTCPASLVYSVRSKWFVLLFWYAVAAHIIWSGIHQYKTLAPFGYAYLCVLTLKTSVQVAVRGFLPTAPVEDIEGHATPRHADAVKA